MFTIRVEKGKPFIFTAEVALRPDVELGEYKGVEIEKVSAEVTEEDIEAEIKKVQEQNAREVTVDRPAENGDTVMIDYEGSVDGELFEGGSAEGYGLVLGSGSFIPGFEDQLVGASAGADVDVHVTFPEAYHADDLAGKEALFKVKVHEVKTKDYPIVDDEFAQDVSEFDTLEEYKEEKPAKRIYQRLKEVSAVDYIRFELEEKETHIFDSKVGGAYYVPRDQNLPVNQKTGAPLYLLAQINFEQIPHIKDFPEKGLLQIFISGDDGVYGLDFDNEYSQSGWCLRYLEEVPKLVDESCVYKFQYSEDTELPLEKDTTFLLKDHLDKQVITMNDIHFDEVVDTYLDENLKEVMQDDEVMDELNDLFTLIPCQIGGYPFFTQYDPRQEDNNEVLLFQLDSQDHILWGDSGVGNFFISKEDLKNKDFSHVRYNWDCY